MNGIKIRGTGRCVPEKTVTNDDLAKIVETSDEWITSRTGIQRRRHCVTETHTSLCVNAARAALEKAGVTPDQIGGCIVATVTADNAVPSAACMLQKELGLPTDIPCFDLNAACTGYKRLFSCACKAFSYTHLPAVFWILRHNYSVQTSDSGMVDYW